MMKQEELVKYWLGSADRDYSTMENLFEKKDYHWSLFIGHLVVEKYLKAYFVKKKNNHPPFIHNLLRLAEKAGLEVDEEQKDFLATVTTFNIRARYDDYKSEFYKACTREFTTEWIERIKEFIKWIKEKHLNA